MFLMHMLTKSNGIKISRLKRDVKDFTSDKEYSCIYAINIQTNSNEYVAFLYMQPKRTISFMYFFLCKSQMEKPLVIHQNH